MNSFPFTFGEAGERVIEERQGFFPLRRIGTLVLVEDFGSMRPNAFRPTEGTPKCHVWPTPSLLPMPLSKRALNEYCVCESTPLAVDRTPLPRFKPPRQTADALRFIISSLRCPDREFASMLKTLPPALPNSSVANPPSECQDPARRRACLSRCRHSSTADAPVLL